MIDLLIAAGLHAIGQPTGMDAICPSLFRLPDGTYGDLEPVPTTIYFDFDDTRLTDAGRLILDRLADNFKRGGTRRLLLSGHTDRSGSAAYNVQLSRRYVEAVRDYLLQRGIPPEDIISQAFGESRPRMDTPDGVREPRNRVVEIECRPRG